MCSCADAGGDVRYGSKADIGLPPRMSVLPPKADIVQHGCAHGAERRADQSIALTVRAPGASLAISAPRLRRCMIAASLAGVLRMFRLAVADLDSPSYFVATAAVELGCFKEEGIEVELERIYGAHVGPERLRDGTLHFYGGPAYAATGAFPA
jgi:hypothetical protein